MENRFVTSVVKSGTGVIFAFIMVFLSGFTANAAQLEPVVITADQIKALDDLASEEAALSELLGSIGYFNTELRGLPATEQQLSLQWQEYQNRYSLIGTAVARGDKCFASLPDLLDTETDAYSGLQRSIRRSGIAVQAITKARQANLTRATDSADSAFDRRKRSWELFSRALSNSAMQMKTCERLHRRARTVVSRAESAAQQYLEYSIEFSEQLAQLQNDWQWLQQQLPALVETGKLQIEGHLPDASFNFSQSLVEELQQHTRPAMSAVQSRRMVNLNHSKRRRLTKLLERVLDAVTYIDLNIETVSGKCRSEACTVFTAERNDLLKQVETLQSQLQQLSTDANGQLKSVVQALAETGDAVQKRHARYLSLADAVAADTSDILPSVRQLQSHASNLQLKVASAHERSRLRWMQAYRTAYQQLPPEHLQQGIETSFPDWTSDGVVRVTPSGTTSMAMHPGTIRNHAFDLFSSLDTEIKGFGAYTYVLVRSSKDLEKRAVRARYDQLLSTLLTLPDAELFSEEVRKSINVFCIPVENNVGVPEDVRDIKYASVLGHQLKIHVQNGLLNNNKIRHKLFDTPGPFLLTVPGRLTDTTSDSPVLLADLSTYPTDAIADLVNLYKRGLVDEFPEQKTLWKPPVKQRIALFMISLAENTGDLLSQVMPTAQAGETQ
ncbi:hypothetical protein AB833_00070 [Chromatiales bacterium (ex Bugula neritina AB1)]|nr:hypothetical protein AB833_00070 [Chromatiales bacterium (ex Bugula neritina AB1)]